MGDHIKKTIDFYDKYAKDYANKVKGMTPTNEFNKFIYMIPKNSRVLDIGCGSGIASELIAQEDHKVTGIDLSYSQVKQSRLEAPSCEFYCMDMRKLELDNCIFNGIWNVASLLHLKKEEAGDALNESYRVLKPRGIMYLATKEGKGEGFEKDLRYDGEEKYYAYYKQDEINKILEIIGFKVLENYLTPSKKKYHKDPWMHIFCQK
ncbi:methyltransferase domain-containing protein [archaeon]|jgi:ubiquinone/menaquinone biosynthesis C-methylase UbiE|nr:methyltransferase domain-containing protein [archaeon]